MISALADILMHVWEAVCHPVRYWLLWVLDFALTGVFVAAMVLTHR